MQVGTAAEALSHGMTAIPGKTAVPHWPGASRVGAASRKQHDAAFAMIHGGKMDRT